MGHSHRPPPTRYGSASPPQAKAAPSSRAAVAPPPTRFGQLGAAQAKAPPPTAGSPPPQVRFGPNPAFQVKPRGAATTVQRAQKSDSDDDDDDYYAEEVKQASLLYNKEYSMLIGRYSRRPLGYCQQVVNDVLGIQIGSVIDDSVYNVLFSRLKKVRAKKREKLAGAIYALIEYYSNMSKAEKFEASRKVYDYMDQFEGSD